MRLRTLLVVVVFLVICTLSRVVDHTFRVSAQENENLHQVMLAVDAMDFMLTGGGPVGYDNYYKWAYATWRKSPERTWLQKALVWDTGFFYFANNPPKNYRYPPHFQLDKPITNSVFAPREKISRFFLP